MTQQEKASRRVLIVEDDDDSREIMQQLIAAFGHLPIPAASAAQALQQARDQTPDVALIDLGLPEIDGCELARRLRIALANTPGAQARLVALTGYSDEATRRSANAAGFDFYMVKPVMPDKLEALLDAP